MLPHPRAHGNPMILRPFLPPDTGRISYRFGCGGKAAGAVVDPVDLPDDSLRAANAGRRVTGG